MRPQIDAIPVGVRNLRRQRQESFFQVIVDQDQVCDLIDLVERQGELAAQERRGAREEDRGRGVELGGCRDRLEDQEGDAAAAEAVVGHIDDDWSGRWIEECSEVDRHGGM